MSSVRLHRLLLVASLLVPAVVFLAAAAWNRAEVLRDNEETITRTTAILHEHARKVLDTVELVLGRVEDHIQNMTLEEIASLETSGFLQRLKVPLEQVVSIWIADAAGRVLAGSQHWDPAITIAGREWFEVHRERDAGTYISAAFEGKATRTLSFAISRRRSTPEGHFAGTIHIALSPEYFSRFFQEVFPPGTHTASLIRQDGTILARSPMSSLNMRLGPESPLMRSIATQPDEGTFSGISTTDGEDRFYAYRRVAPYPVYVISGVDVDAVFGRWYRNLAVYATVAGLSALTLLLVSWLALRRAEAEQVALVQLRHESEQRLAAEQRLLQAQKMESIGQLTGGIAHDFNNLLAVILGNLDLLRKRITDERAKRLLEGAIQGAQRGAALTQRLLAFSRRQDLTPQAVDVPRLVAGMTDLLSRSLGPSIKIATWFPADLPPVKVDPNQLEMALLNLAVNARDAMTVSGKITISARAEDVEQDNVLSPGAYVCVCVSDTGMGMDAATLARAIEPFFTTKGVGKGTGLGLSMIHGLAVQSGGTLRLKSEVGKGTTAEIWLPQGEPVSEIRPCHERERPARRACTVLLVEDDPLVMMGTAAMLEDLGHTVAEASSGEAALSILRTDVSIDLVVTDHAMPGMTGLELAERIRTKWPSMPILLASGHAELPERAGLAIPRLTKPFQRDELENAIASMVTPNCKPSNVVSFPRA
ncbi:hybrid sensor histidine kinase/response regulator [Microvirga makkahensis]|uniref:histidine kinase n=1 Tax=Microvirga makkahensis TaxID=1128670 RepID=A0A7X3MUA0_9HYPH|nr:hybrid sensor histidine kinase/response regulator [Microvirga makkahensis]MXQ13376.1 response regulator [Microvirga makkahensis]